MYSKKLKTKWITLIALSSIFMFSGCSASTEQAKTVASETKTSEVIKTESQKIAKQAEKILSEKENETKLTDYKKLVSDSDSYSKSKKNEKQIVQAYADAIKKIKTNFKEQDEKQLKENQLTHVDQASKMTLNQKSTALNALKSWIQKENTVVYSQDELTSLTTKIDKLVTNYQDQSKKITEAEKKAAAEKAAAEQAAAQQAAAEQAAAQQAAADQATVSANGYKRDAKGRWHRPNGQYASKAEIAAAGLPW
ncbi:hypothetical protein [Enterococcus sp. AZ102]|uniref:hypothetical protein n=1 Tax=unclassified Enterococcus TaxID=2608891 RepID=UPI003F267BE1